MKRNGRNRFAVGNVGVKLTQGSSCLATLGFGTESRWDSPMACRDNPKGVVTFSPRLAQSAYLGLGLGNGNNANGVVAWRRRVEVLRAAAPATACPAAARRRRAQLQPRKSGAGRA